MIEHPQVQIVDELRQQLDGKDEVIAALVAELEQVVEQLDRVKRNGADRQRSGATSASIPAEVMEEQQQVLGDLQRFVSQWDEMQAASTLGRIESELSELRKMISHGPRRDFEGDHDSDVGSNRMDSVLSTINRHDEESSPMVTLSGTDWEAMKRQMLNESEDSSGVSDDELVKLLDEVAAPHPIDLEAANYETLKKACAERDTYIVQITRWIRTRRAVSLPENWDEIPEVPEELREKVDQLAARLEEQVRLAEVEMSLERARLSREKSQVQADRAVMEKHLKRLGITSLDELEDIAVSNSNSTGDRRWMRFLGVNRKS